MKCLPMGLLSAQGPLIGVLRERQPLSPDFNHVEENDNVFDTPKFRLVEIPRISICDSLLLILT